MSAPSPHLPPYLTHSAQTHLLPDLRLPNPLPPLLCCEGDLQRSLDDLIKSLRSSPTPSPILSRSLDGIDATVVTAVVGDGFIARDNTTGPQKHLVVALCSGSDLSVFYRCSFTGYQDTLYVYSQRQFYRDCDVYGTVDFIFRKTVAFLQNCNIYVRRPMSNQKNTITAQGKTDPNQHTGISVHNSKIIVASDLRPMEGSFKTYLGRSWKQYSRTVYMKSNLDGLIAPVRWLEWSGNFALCILYYEEYMNTGAWASTDARVSWKSFCVISNVVEAGKLTVGSFVAGNSWIPATGMPFTPGL